VYISGSEWSLLEKSMSLTSSSTLATALAQYNDNLSWDGSPAKAVLALEAVRWLLINRAESISGENESINYASIDSEKGKLESYIAAAGTTSRSTKTSFTRGRMLT